MAPRNLAIPHRTAAVRDAAAILRCLTGRAMLPGMSVEFVPAAAVREILSRIALARQSVISACGSPSGDAVHYWQTFFEANAAAVLAAPTSVTLSPGHVVRYRYFGWQGRDLLVRPFVARAATDVDSVRALLDWHPPPDSASVSQRHAPTQDAELLYRHFSFPRTPVGVFEYWCAMQELWASQRWAYAQVLASADELSRITSGPGWEVRQPVETCEPAVVLEGRRARLAVLVECPLDQQQVSLQQIDIEADQSLRYADPILVAAGPRGYAA